MYRDAYTVRKVIESYDVKRLKLMGNPKAIMIDMDLVPINLETLTVTLPLICFPRDSLKISLASLTIHLGWSRLLSFDENLIVFLSYFTSLYHLTLVFEDSIVPMEKLTLKGFYSNAKLTQLKSVTFVFME